MRAVVTRVSSASVEVNSACINRIGQGLLVLVGIGVNDTPDDCSKLAKKIASLKLFDAEDGMRWKRCVLEVGEILCISQFTLHARTNKSKPDFSLSEKPDRANELYESLIAKLKEDMGNNRIKSGVFGAMMQVESVNDGPVTIILDTKS